MICMDRATLRRYYVVKQYEADGKYCECNTGKRYSLVKIYV